MSSEVLDHAGTVLQVRFGEQSDGGWWAILPSGKALWAERLGELFDQVHQVVHDEFGSQVAYEMLQV